MSNEVTGVHGADLYCPDGIADQYKPAEVLTPVELEARGVAAMREVRDTLHSMLDLIPLHHKEIIMAIHGTREQLAA